MTLGLSKVTRPAAQRRRNPVEDSVLAFQTAIAMAIMSVDDEDYSLAMGSGILTIYTATLAH